MGRCGCSRLRIAQHGGVDAAENVAPLIVKLESLQFEWNTNKQKIEIQLVCKRQ